MPKFLRWSSYRLRTKDLIVIALSVMPMIVFWGTTALGFLRRDLTAGQFTRNVAIEALAQAYDAQVRRSESAVLLVMFLGSIVCVGGGVWVALVKANGLTRRISLLSINAHRLARGEPIEALPAGEDEIAELDVQFREAAHLLRLREEQLRHSGQLLDSFFNNLSHDLFCIAGFDGYLKRVNPAWEKTFGFSTAELLESRYLEFVHLEDRDRTEAALLRLSRGREIIDLKNRFRCKDGTYRWLRWNAQSQPSEGRIYASARDVTDKVDLTAALQRRTDELEVANRELEAFSYSVSHDLRAPLRAIDGFSEAIEIDCAERLDDSGRDALRRVRSAARRMGSLIDELLNLSRLTRSELKRQRLDLAEEAESILTDLKRRSPSRDIDVQIEPGLVVDADPHMVRIALENLIHNAWKYTGKTPYPRIEVGSMPNGHARVFHVKDNGAGFDMTYARKLFGAFQRLHSDHEFEGTGVGLAIVQRIVHRHGGRIWANASINAGATFYFTLQPEDAESV